MLFASLFGPIIDFEIVLQPLRLSKFPEEDVAHSGLVGHVAESRHYAFPVRQKSAQVIIDETNLKQILNRVKRPHFLIGFEILIKEVQHLPSPHCPVLGCLSLFEDENLTGQFPSRHSGKSLQELCVER